MAIIAQVAGSGTELALTVIFAIPSTRLGGTREVEHVPLVHEVRAHSVNHLGR